MATYIKGLIQQYEEAVPHAGKCVNRDYNTFSNINEVSREKGNYNPEAFC